MIYIQVVKTGSMGQPVIGLVPPGSPETFACYSTNAGALETKAAPESRLERDMPAFSGFFDRQ